ncbi:MAG TPA: sigma-54 dependent transcriptional regulator, partial [Kofleriaceae bacterium]|nr:sigma-54 dependent transcriptional regulator [Kofleriaceae bacterium]
LSRNAPDFAWPGRALGQPLGDPFVSRRPIRFAPGAEGRIRMVVDEGGTPVVAGAPVRGGVELAPEDVAAGIPIELAERVVLLLHLHEPGAGRAPEPLGMVGESAGIRRVRAAIERVVDLPVPVLIRGETGTGKELVARAIHDRSPRRGGPFVSVNLGALPRELAAAELFGALKGAYTGATRDREGLFRAAHGGTLFLDEVAEAPPEVQVMLLRVLETGELYPVGAERPIAAQVRLIAATDADLEAQIREGRFRGPLLHRLAGYEVRIPPLRERREDIGVLFYHFAREELAAIGEAHRLSPPDPYARPWLPAHLAARLIRHPWPGNIRQLRNLARQLVIGSRGLPQAALDPRLAEELAAASSGAAPAGAEPPEPDGAPRRKPSEVTEPELLEALRACAWDLKAAAVHLRIPRPSIYTLIDRSPNIRTAGDLGADEIVRCFRECAGDLDVMVGRLQVSKRALSRRVKELGLAARADRRRDKEIW